MADIKPSSARRTTIDIKQFVVAKPGEFGGDFTYEWIEQVIIDMAKWFARPESGKKYADPLARAREMIRECLLGIKKDGSVWDTATNDFATRVKIKCNYNIKTKKGVPVRQRKRKLSEEAADGAKQIHGMNPVATNINIVDTRQQYVADILNVFPELNNAAHLPNLESLADVYVQRKVISGELELLGANAAKRSLLLEQLKTIETMADSMMNKLGIHPNQVRKKVSEDANSSVADLVAQIDEDADFRQRERQWALQLALQLWWCSEHHNHPKTGPNLSDWEIYHITRSRPIRYTCSCSREVLLVEGFEPHELRDFLLKEGVLVEVPVIPALISNADLQGLATATPEVLHEEIVAG